MFAIYRHCLDAWATPDARALPKAGPESRTRAARLENDVTRVR